MCLAVTYTYQGELVQAYFKEPSARIPVLKRDGSVVLLPWGRRQKQSGQLPLGGWARLSAIHDHKWDRYMPQPVKLPLRRFLEQDFEGKCHWFHVIEGQWLQGLIASWEDEMRVYVVTITPQREDAVFTRWPRLIFAP